MKTSCNPWPLGIVLAFVIFIVGMAAAVVIAATHRDSLVNENYYEQELKFQNQINAAARAKNSGASVALGTVSGSLVVGLPPAQMAGKISGTIELYRPSAPALDRIFPLAPKADGTQALDIAKFAAGSWVVRVRWTVDGQDYFLEQKIILPEK